MPEPVATAELVEEVVEDVEEIPAGPPPRRKRSADPSQTPPKRSGRPKRPVPSDRMTVGDWIAGVILFPIMPIICVLYMMRGNKKWIPLLALSASIFVVLGGIGYWKWDGIVDSLAWYGKEDQRSNENQNRVYMPFDAVPDDGTGIEGSEELQEFLERQEEARKQAEARSEALQAPPSDEDLNQMDEIRQRAYRANVRIDVEGFGLGSGIVCQMEDGSALILTNRHVIDPSYQDDRVTDAVLGELPPNKVTYVNAEKLKGKVVWVAKGGVDLALVKAECPKTGIREANWRKMPRITVGERVFAVGNPVGLGWTYTQGSVSALRRDGGGVRVPVVQVDAAINQGNSGGGLYNEQGELIGINNFIINPALATNAGFAIRAEILKDLKPEGLNFQSAGTGAEAEVIR